MTLSSLAFLLGIISSNPELEYTPHGMSTVMHVIQASADYNLKPNILLAQMYWESGFDPNAENVNSSSVDRGLMQINSRYERLFALDYYKATGTRLSTEEIRRLNTLLGAFVYSTLYERFGDDEIALRAYNGGSENVVKGTLQPRSIAYARIVIALSREQAFSTQTLPAFIKSVFRKRSGGRLSKEEAIALLKTKGASLLVYGG